MGPISGQWAQFPATNKVARFFTQIKLQLLHVTLNHFHSLILIKLFKKIGRESFVSCFKKYSLKSAKVNILVKTGFSAQGSRQSKSYRF